MSGPVRRIVLGLGNPGAEHEESRHNVGFRVLDVLARRAGVLFQGSRILSGYAGPGALAVARLDEPGALLAKPLTYMNRSGVVVPPLLAWSGLAPEDLMVVLDDMDLPVGELRLRPKGGAGGQKGLRSILEVLATDAVPRLRVGIGRPPTDAVRHVLSPFTAEERERIDVAAEQAADALRDWLSTGDLEGCMTRFHSRWKRGSDGPARQAEER